ncbi:MAG: hypothetical protein AB1489_15355 [Acidobacteriota bacterium]
MATKPARSPEKKQQRTLVNDLKTTLRAANPTILKDRLYLSLIALNENDRVVVFKELFAALSDHHVNVHNHLLLLGGNPNQLLDATANDVALLIRYYRINALQLLDIVASVLERFAVLKQALATLQDEQVAA